MDYIFFLLTFISIYSLIVISMNILLGYLGILYLAQPAVVGIGAYTFANLAMRGTPFTIALLAGGISGAIATFLLSFPALKLKSHYIGMTTLGFLLIINGIAINAKEITRGALGIPGIPKPSLFGYIFFTNFEQLLLISAISIICCAILYKILHSPFAKKVEMIREDEIATKTLGKNVYLTKIQIFVISGFFGGIGGGLMATFLGFINPWNFDVKELIMLLAMAIIGGLASFWGSILGAIIIVLLPEILRFLPIPPDIVGALRYGLYGLLIILFMIYKPSGILGRITKTK